MQGDQVRRLGDIGWQTMPARQVSELRITLVLGNEELVTTTRLRNGIDVAWRSTVNNQLTIQHGYNPGVLMDQWAL